MRVALVGPTDLSIWRFRRGLINGLVAQGHSVHVLSGAGPHVRDIESLGAFHVPVAMFRFMGPLADARYTVALYRVFHRERFDVVHTFTVKPNVYGAAAARLAGVRRVYATVEGLGFGYMDGSGLRPRVWRGLIRALYRVACSQATRVWFVNHDDRQLFLDAGLIERPKAVFIRSIGVDPAEFSMSAASAQAVARLRHELGAETSSAYVTMIARMVWSKGVREFVEAARLLEQRYPRVRFLMVGDITDGSPLSVPKEYLMHELPRNTLWLDFRPDVREILALSDVVVLPSYYREGVPRTLLEAMAMGKPIITTDSPGCREVVLHGSNGYLVPPRDAKALAQSVAALLDDAAKRAEFGRHGRSWVEAEFDEALIVQRVLRELYGLGTHGCRAWHGEACS